MATHKKALLMILDGWGIGDGSESVTSILLLQRLSWIT